MNHHLTMDEIIRLADHEVANGALTKAMQHVASCAECEREVKFQRALRKTSEEVISSRVSKDFTTSVLRAVGVKAPKGFLSRLSDNIGSAFALLMVIGLFGIISSNIPSFDSSSAKSDKGIWETAVQGVKTLSQQIRSVIPSLPSVAKPSAANGSSEFLAPVAVAFFLLLAADMGAKRYRRIHAGKRS